MSTKNPVALTAELNQSHKNLLVKYFDSTENPTLEHFVSTHVPHVFHPEDLNIKQYWSGQYKIAATNAKKPYVQGEPDWYDAYFQSIQKQAVTNTPSTHTQTFNPSSVCSSNFLQQMLQAHSKMKDKKWTLPSGVIVEDKMLDFCRQLDYEHAGHSFILDVNDGCWETVFEPEDLQYIKSYELPSFVTQEDEEVLSYIKSFDGKLTYDDLMAHVTRHSPYTSKESYSITWLRQSIMNLLTNYKYGFFSRTGVTESDILFRVWSSIQYAYEDTIISVNSDKKEIQATSDNNNVNRSLGKRKLHGTRVDLRFVYDGAELGCAEAGRTDEGELGTKELNESNLKCLKTLRDMYVLLLKKYPDKQNEISTFAFILMGLSVFVLVMDSPGGSVCRVSRSPRYQVTTDIRAFSSRVIPLLHVFLQVKKTMLNVVSQITTSSIPTLTLGQSNNIPIPYSISSSLSSSKSSSSKTTSSKTTPKKQRTGSLSTSGSSATQNL